MPKSVSSVLLFCAVSVKLNFSVALCTALHSICYKILLNVLFGIIFQCRFRWVGRQPLPLDGTIDHLSIHQIKEAILQKHNPYQLQSVADFTVSYKTSENQPVTQIIDEDVCKSIPDAAFDRDGECLLILTPAGLWMLAAILKPLWRFL